MDDETENAESAFSFKNIALNVLGVIIIIGLVCSAIYYVHWYKAQDHSTYGRLTQTTYSQDGLNYTYQYPSILRNSPSFAKKLQGAPVAYSYSLNNNLQVVEAVSHENISNVLKVLNLTPAQYMLQLLSGKGDYIKAIDSEQGNINAYAQDFPGCAKQFMTTNSGQKVLVCVNSPPHYINARVIGATKTNEYTLELIMLPSVWKDHQKIWQEIEKNFSFK
jgi:hypothetical protein